MATRLCLVLLHLAAPVRGAIVTPRSISSQQKGSVRPQSAPVVPNDQFDWFGRWYPLNVVDTMDPARPHKMYLLGLNLVAWNDGITVDGRKQIGAWRVFEDMCPHRLGPLSEGRVEEDGNLLCSYHGWRFDGTGGCASLPYSLPRAAERQRSSGRAGCNSFPVRVIDGLLWVFPRSGHDAYELAGRAEMPLIDELHDPALEGRWRWKFPAGVRDFPCTWDMMVEKT